LLVFWGIVVSAVLSTGSAVADDDIWHHTNDDGETVTEFYFVYSSTCPHCQRAEPFIANLEESFPWLHVVWLQAVVLLADHMARGSTPTARGT
jgi:thiol-disulfide isomerase/thioredoxin